MKIHINQLKNLIKRFYRNIKDVSSPFTQEEFDEFDEVFGIFFKELKEVNQTNVRNK